VLTWILYKALTSSAIYLAPHFKRRFHLFASIFFTSASAPHFSTFCDISTDIKRLYELYGIIFL
jgi:hypothetical protein